MQRGTRPVTLSYKGASLTIDMPGWYCDQSDASAFSDQDLKFSNRALNRLKASVEGLLEPAEIRRIRKRLRMSQEQAGELIGGSANTFNKCEAGDMLPMRAVNNVLILLDYNPSMLALLTQRGPRSARVSQNGLIAPLAGRP